MSNVPSDLQYTKTHEWVRTLPDGVVEIGITDHAQESLGDVVFVELPELGRRLAVGEAYAVVESVKAAADVYAPVAGEVVAVNSELGQAPERLNADPYGAWIALLKLTDGGAAAQLLGVADYLKQLEAESRE